MGCGLRLALLGAVALHARALSFKLGGLEQRCVGESVPAKTLLAGDWLCSHHNSTDSHSATLTIRSPADTVVFEKHDASGHFAITTSENGVHRVCILNNDTTARLMTINIKVRSKYGDHCVSLCPLPTFDRMSGLADSARSF